MDQARWIVVFSVIVFMIATLTLLHKFSKPSVEPLAKPAEQNESVSLPVVSDQPEKVAQPSVMAKPTSIKFSRPPAHVFAVENNEAFARENRESSTRGKIIE
ncbi:MAG: hypothetical protein PWR01_4009 [Clostridiales bacterium]|jgi:hypothetical protein|nr:hypothetical protein [Clostridiales bacterium]MDN5282936.1 hypothetical protein [Candidatus Ozemobacter sp.]